METPDHTTAAEYLLGRERHITAPYIPGVEPLPTPPSAMQRLWENIGRIAPAAVTTAAALLAWAWHEQLPEGTAQPLWINGLLAAVAAGAGAVSAAQPHGERATTRTAFAGAGALAVLGVAAWTPLWSLRVLLWLVSTAAVYAVCAPLWRTDRRIKREQQQERVLAADAHHTAVTLAAVESQTRTAVAETAYRTEVARAGAISNAVEALVAATDHRTQHTVAPGEELSVSALLHAAGHTAPVELAAADRIEKEINP